MTKFTSIAITALTLAALATSTTNAQWATLKGQFLYGKEGTKVPAATTLTPTKDVEVCGKNQLFNESLVINDDNRGIANVVLWAFKPKGNVHADYESSANDIIKMDNAGCRFEPHAVLVRTGPKGKAAQTLEIGNSDSVGHNSLINFLKNNSVNPIIPAQGKVEFKLTKSEIIPVKVSCSIHPWMQGIVLVQDHPYMAITDKDGKFEIKNLPAGKQTLKVWHEKAGYIQTVTIDGQSAAWKKGRYAINMKSGKDEDHEFVVEPKVFAK